MRRALSSCLLFLCCLNVFGQNPKASVYLSKLVLPNDTIKHSNDAVVLINANDSVFYFSQEVAPPHRIAEPHLFLVQKKTVQEVKIPFPKELPIDRLLFVDNENRTLFLTCAANGDDIYYSKVIAGKWQKPMPFVALNSPARESGMCVSPDKKRIIFSSARERETNLNLDLYMVQYQEDGLWTKPQLLKSISSEEDEDDPRFSPDGKSLYFASKGFNSTGKYDLFRSSFDETSGSWSAPVNLGPGINSEFNELSPSINAKGDLTIFCSDRFAKPGDYNLYRPVKSGKMLFSVQINDADSSLQIGNLKVELTPEDAVTVDGQVKINSQTGIYADSLFLNRWYTLRIMDENNVLVTERIRLTTSSRTSKSFYIDLSKIKDPYLIYEGKRIPLLTKYVLRYEKEESLPNKNNQKVLERVAELLSHLHIYQVEIQYPSSLPADQQATIASRVENLQKYLLKNKASGKDILLSRQASGKVDEITLKMEFKLKIH